MTHSLIKELISNDVINEALISKKDLPKVDPSQAQVMPPESSGVNADGSSNSTATPDEENQKESEEKTSQLESFQAKAECLTSCMKLAEYHCESLMECKQLKEMENAVSERLKLAAQMLKTAKEYVSEIESGYVAPPVQSISQPSPGNTDVQSY